MLWMNTGLDGRTPRSKMCCSAHLKLSQVTGKRTVERIFMALHIHTFLKLHFCQIKCLEPEKVFWESIAMGWCAPTCFTLHLLCHYLIQDLSSYQFDWVHSYVTFCSWNSGRCSELVTILYFWRKAAEFVNVFPLVYFDLQGNEKQWWSSKQVLRSGFRGNKCFLEIWRLHSK